MKTNTITTLLVLFVFAVTLYLNPLSKMRLSNANPLMPDVQYDPPDDFNFDLNTALFVPPLRTQGRYILDAEDKRFKLASVNWYGASDRLFVPGGLDIRHRSAIAKTIRSMGFNSVRLPYSDELVTLNPQIPPGLLTANPDLIGSRALEVFAASVTALTDAGLAVIINNHITEARWCCDGNLCDATWSNTYLGPLCRVKQSESEWIEHWETIMRPHIDDPRVIGADLRNEVRSPLNAWIWGTWAAAAERASERLLAMQPNWLMVVEGTSSANDLSPAYRRPIKLSVPNRVVYSAHVYAWSGWGSFSPYWGRKYASFERDMQRNWGYLLEKDIAPVWVGEFGAPGVPRAKDMQYWRNLMRFLEKVDVDFGYWAINPRKPDQNEEEGYSLLQDDWETVRWDYRMRDMAKLMPTMNGTASR